jgi:hypothetical protein
MGAAPSWPAMGAWGKGAGGALAKDEEEEGGDMGRAASGGGARSRWFCVRVNCYLRVVEEKEKSEKKKRVNERGKWEKIQTWKF